VAGRRGGEDAFGGLALTLYLRDPRGDDGGVRAAFERGAVAGETLVAVGQLPGRGLDPGLVGVVGTGRRGERRAGVVEVLGVEEGGEPRVERGHHFVLADVDDAGVIDFVHQRVLVRVPAAVEVPPVGVLAGHAPPAQPADQQPSQHIRPRPAVRLAACGFAGRLRPA
jgi:hypothetical protein